MSLELGLNTFGDVQRGPDGTPLPHAIVLRNVLAEAELADRLGLDYLAVGEHHRADYAISAPEVVLAAIAGRTGRIRLGSAVTVLSSDDPVRVHQRFATLDALSSGRAEMVLGRGSFVESFPLFGYQLEDDEDLFEEKLNLLTRIRAGGPVNWSGRTRAPLSGQHVHPEPEHGPLPTWVGVGGSPESVIRAARYGLRVEFAIIGGRPAAFAPLRDLFRRALAEVGRPEDTPVAAHCPGYVAQTDEAAREEYRPHWSAHNAVIGRERGWPPASRANFDAQCADGGALFVGSPETVARRIRQAAADLDLSRFDLKYSMGSLPHENLMRCIELYATEVAPRVREG